VPVGSKELYVIQYCSKRRSLDPDDSYIRRRISRECKIELAERYNSVGDLNYSKDASCDAEAVHLVVGLFVGNRVECGVKRKREVGDAVLLSQEVQVVAQRKPDVVPWRWLCRCVLQMPG